MMNPHSEDDKDNYRGQQIQKESGRDPFDVDEEFAREVSTPVPVQDSFGRKSETDDTEFAVDGAVPRTTMNDRSFTPRRDFADERKTSYAGGRQGTMLGWISLILGIGSLFFWQAVLGPAAILTGIFAWMNGKRALGSWAIVLGFIAVVAYFILVPYYA